MAYEINVGLDITFPASGDLSANQFRFVNLNSSKQTVLAAANGSAIGVQQDAPSAAGRGSQVRCGGVTKLLLGGTVAAGDKLASDSNGKGVKYTAASVSAGTPEPLAGSFVLGIALEAGVSGDIVSALIVHAGVSN